MLAAMNQPDLKWAFTVKLTLLCLHHHYQNMPQLICYSHARMKDTWSRPTQLLQQSIPTNPHNYNYSEQQSCVPKPSLHQINLSHCTDA